jgi:membrane protein DedA with SNARE-associated domain
MHQTLDFVLRHGYLLIFVNVFLEQLGFPIPTQPILLAFGALAGAGKMSYPAGLALAVLAALSSDTVWYWLGRNRGAAVLRLLCRISLEPDSCVRQTENVFLRYGPRALLFAKFVPGLSAAFPPMAGNFRMPLWKFWLFDGMGALAWAGSYSVIGWVFHSQIDNVLGWMLRAGSWIIAVVLIALATYIAVKYIARRRFLHQLWVARIEVAELRAKLDRGEGVVIIDLRKQIERDEDPMKIPSAIALNFCAIESGLTGVPRDQDVVLYCT